MIMDSMAKQDLICKWSDITEHDWFLCLLDLIFTTPCTSCSLKLTEKT